MPRPLGSRSQLEQEPYRQATLKLKVEARFLRAQPWEEGSGTKPASPLSNFLSCGEQQQTGAGSTGPPLGSRSLRQAALQRRGGDVHTTCRRVRSFHVLPGWKHSPFLQQHHLFILCSNLRSISFCFVLFYSDLLVLAGKKKAATKILAVTKPSQ